VVVARARSRVGSHSPTPACQEQQVPVPCVAALASRRSIATRSLATFRGGRREFHLGQGQDAALGQRHRNQAGRWVRRVSNQA